MGRSGGKGRGLLLLAALVLAAAPAAGAEIDPCQLLREGEVAQALAARSVDVKVVNLARRGNEIVAGTCSYRAPGRPRDQVTVTLEAMPELDQRARFEAGRSRPGLTPLEGLGEGAYAFVSPGGFVELVLLQGDAILRLVASGHADLAAARRLAGLAAGRLGGAASGSGDTPAPVARIPGLEALVGAWSVHEPVPSPGIPGPPWAVVEVQGSGAWHMERAEVHTATASARDGTLRLHWPGGGLEARYESLGPDVFEVRGAIAARFDRVFCGYRTWFVHPALLETLPVPLASSDTRALDPALAGLWVGVGRRDGESVFLVWYLLESGEASLLFASNRDGRLSAESGALSFQPNRAPAETGSYRVIDPETLELVLPSRRMLWRRMGFTLLQNQTPAGPTGPCP